MNENEFDFLINNICFPCKLPDFTNEDEIRNEVLLLNLITKIINFCSTLDFVNVTTTNYNEIKRMFGKWSVLQGYEYLEGNEIHNSIKNLNENESTVFYLRAQNSCFIVNRKLGESYIISAFQASASNRQVMSADSDLLALYPAFSFHVKNKDILLSQSFANQLEELATGEITYATSKKARVDNIETRDVPESTMVFEWVPAILVAHHSSVNADNEKTIYKKIRDDIVHSNQLLPFRRSGLWMSIKVVLQLRLYQLFGDIDGKVIYKVIMILVVNKLCQDSCNYNLSSDLELQMIKKLARRLYKLDLLLKYSKSCYSLDSVVNMCVATIEKVKARMNEKLKKFVNNTRSTAAKLDLSQIGLNDVIHQKLDKLMVEINKLKSVSPNQNYSNVAIPPCSPRNLPTCLFPNINFLNSSGCLITALYDIEYWVENLDLENFQENVNSIDSLNLITLMENYITQALSFYKGDEMGNSRMIVTCMKIVCLLDILANNKFQMLAQYKLGFDIKALECLLMPRSKDLLYMESLKKYIESRNKNIIYDSLVDCENITENTFAVKFASLNYEMQQLKRKIIQEAETQTRLKKEELEQERNVYYRLLKQIAEKTCDYDTCNNYKRHSRYCNKCALENRANNMEVDIYEWPLPENKNLENAVVFELIIPQRVCYLRDALHLLRTKIFGLTNKLQTDFHGTWIKYEAISKHSIKIQRHVTFGSNTKLFSHSHYKKAPKNPDSHFLKPNGFSVFYSDKHQIFSYDTKTTYENLCIFQATHPYNNLQWTIAGTSHTENQVLASQSKCPQELTIREYIKYGCFRAGHRLQMTNLLDAIETRSLSFKHSAVFALLAQTLWQVGPLNSIGEKECHFKWCQNFVFPASHADFSKPDYILKLHEMLSKLLILSSKCWNDHIIMLNIIIIINRAISLCPNDECRYLMLKLIFECRVVLQDWMIRISTVINEPKHFNKNQILKENLFEICCFNILTFYMDKKHLELHMNSSEHVIQWLSSMSYIYDNKIVAGSGFRRNLYRRVLICMLEIEDHIFKIINNQRF